MFIHNYIVQKIMFISIWNKSIRNIIYILYYIRTIYSLTERYYSVRFSDVIKNIMEMLQIRFGMPSLLLVSRIYRIVFRYSEIDMPISYYKVT